MDEGLLKELRRRTWFYNFELPDGTRIESALEPDAQPVHVTRLEMMASALEREFGSDWSGLKVLDVACHQGYFSCHLAARGAQVLGVDARSSHIEDSRLIARALGVDKRTEFRQSDVHDLDAETLGSFDVVLMFGLLYHLENPVGALRLARALTARLCLVETQVSPGLSGVIDWGHYRFVKSLHGAFGIVDETEETHGGEASTTGICLVPSLDALIWIMQKLKFSEVETLKPPEGAYEQLRYGKRVLVAARA